MRKIVPVLLLSLLPIALLYAQGGYEERRAAAQKNYQERRADADQHYRDYRAKVNADYAENMRRVWDKFRASQAVPAPSPPELKTPPVADPKREITSDSLPIENIIAAPAPEPRAQPIPKTEPPPEKPVAPPPAPPKAPPVQPPAPPAQPSTAPSPPSQQQPALVPPPQQKPPTPVPQQQPAQTPTAPPAPKQPDKPAFSFRFFNTECSLPLSSDMRFKLRDASEASVTQAWTAMSNNPLYDKLIDESVALRDRMNLSDWGYMQLLQAASESFLGKNSNEAVLLPMFVLAQSGYKVRIARTGDSRLALLIPIRQEVYHFNFVIIGGVKHYLVNKDLKGQDFFVHNRAMPGERYFSLQTGQPRLTEKLTPPKTFTSKRYPPISVSVQTNQNLLDYYNNYPLSRNYDLYTLTGLSQTVKQSLYPALQKAVAGKTKAEGAQILLTFVQNSFEYKVCSEQFGYERAFFPDENFYFPYNNCKHRASLYALLVKEVLGLEAVLLHYPGATRPDNVGHVAAGVHIPEENVKGDHYIIDGKKFIVCDPSYIDADIGVSVAEYKSIPPRVLKL